MFTNGQMYSQTSIPPKLCLEVVHGGAQRYLLVPVGTNQNLSDLSWNTTPTCYLVKVWIETVELDSDVFQTNKYKI